MVGTQSLCCCKNLKLINCSMENTDSAIEYSDFEADIKSYIVYIKKRRQALFVQIVSVR